MIICQIIVIEDPYLKNYCRSSYLIVKNFRFVVNDYVEAIDFLALARWIFIRDLLYTHNKF